MKYRNVARPRENRALQAAAPCARRAACLTIVALVVCTHSIDNKFGAHAAETTPSIPNASDVLGTFPGLEKAVFYTGLTVYYDPALGKPLLGKPRASAEYAPQEIPILQTKFSGSGKDEYVIYFYLAAAGSDVHYTVKQITGRGQERPVGTLAGLGHTSPDGENHEFIMVPGNGALYLWTNGAYCSSLFTRHEYAQSGGKLEEIRQPYLYVGRAVTAKNPVVLLNNERKPIATIAAGDKAELMLLDPNAQRSNNRNRFLVRTSLGLVGWATIACGCGVESFEGVSCCCN